MEYLVDYACILLVYSSKYVDKRTQKVLVTFYYVFDYCLSEGTILDNSLLVGLNLLQFVLTGHSNVRVYLNTIQEGCQQGVPLFLVILSKLTQNRVCCTNMKLYGQPRLWR